MPKPLTLMTVHRHPDDEAIGNRWGAGAIRRRGVPTVLVTCTGGEVGEIAHPDMATPETLGEVRARELPRGVLGPPRGALYWLGYRDSGMAGTTDERPPLSFKPGADRGADRQARGERPGRAAGRGGHLRRERLLRPPRPRQANRITVAAFEAAARLERVPGGGPALAAEEAVYSAVPRSRMLEFPQRLREAGITPPFERELSDEARRGARRTSW